MLGRWLLRKGRRVVRPTVVDPNRLDYARRLRDEGATIADGPRQMRDKVESRHANDEAAIRRGRAGSSWSRTRGRELRYDPTR